MGRESWLTFLSLNLAFQDLTQVNGHISPCALSRETQVKGNKKELIFCKMRQELSTYPRLVSNYISLLQTPSSLWDYRCEPPCQEQQLTGCFFAFCVSLCLKIHLDQIFRWGRLGRLISMLLTVGICIVTSRYMNPCQCYWAGMISPSCHWGRASMKALWCGSFPRRCTLQSVGCILCVYV